VHADKKRDFFLDVANPVDGNTEKLFSPVLKKDQRQKREAGRVEIGIRGIAVSSIRTNRNRRTCPFVSDKLRQREDRGGSISGECHSIGFTGMQEEHMNL
jgi:hypothetical protein